MDKIYKVKLHVTYKCGTELTLNVIDFFGETETGWRYGTRMYPMGVYVHRELSKKYVENVEVV